MALARMNGVGDGDTNDITKMKWKKRIDGSEERLFKQYKTSSISPPLKGEHSPKPKSARQQPPKRTKRIRCDPFFSSLPPTTFRRRRFKIRILDRCDFPLKTWPTVPTPHTPLINTPPSVFLGYQVQSSQYL